MEGRCRAEGQGGWVISRIKTPVECYRKEKMPGTGPLHHGSEKVGEEEPHRKLRSGRKSGVGGVQKESPVQGGGGHERCPACDTDLSAGFIDPH
jgi:hypothetical protein